MEMTLKEKLANIQQELKAPKDMNNDFGGYKYRSAEQIEELVKPICFKNRTTLYLSDEIVLKGERYYCIATARLEDWDSDDVKETKAEAREQESQKGMSEPQITGSVSSYSRKYALCGLFLIDDSKDDPDTKDNRDEGPKTPATAEQIKFLTENSKALTTEFKRFGIKTQKDLAKISTELASELIKMAQAK